MSTLSDQKLQVQSDIAHTRTSMQVMISALKGPVESVGPAWVVGPWSSVGKAAEDEAAAAGEASLSTLSTSNPPLPSALRLVRKT